MDFGLHPHAAVAHSAAHAREERVFRVHAKKSLSTAFELEPFRRSHQTTTSKRSRELSNTRLHHGRPPYTYLTFCRHRLPLSITHESPLPPPRLRSQSPSREYRRWHAPWTNANTLALAAHPEGCTYPRTGRRTKGPQGQPARERESTAKEPAPQPEPKSQP